MRKQPRLAITGGWDVPPAGAPRQQAQPIRWYERWRRRYWAWRHAQPRDPYITLEDLRHRLQVDRVFRRRVAALLGWRD